MREVNELLCIGNALDARNPKTILAANIKAVVDLAADEPPAFRTPREIISVRVPLVDCESNSAESLVIVVNTVATLLSAKIRTLVCCSAGLSRSPAVAAAGWAFATNQNFESALKEVAESGPCQVNPGMAQSIMDTFEQLR